MIGCRVSLWGTPIGTLVLREDGKTASFNYDARFLGSEIGLSPIHMPLRDRIYSFPLLPFEAFRGLPGIFADSLPDRYGNAVIDAWCEAHGKNSQDFSAIERLCYIGKRGMGAYEYSPALVGEKTVNEQLRLDELTDFAAAILSKRSALSIPKNGRQIEELFQVSSSAGGARAKALINLNEKTGEIRSGQTSPDPGFSSFLIKFDKFDSSNKEDKNRIHYTLIEYAYYRLAIHAGIRMAPCRLLKEGENSHFLAKRFDRTADGEKILMSSLGGLDHADFNAPGAYSYERGARVMDQLGIPASEKEEYFRRLVFNVVFCNQDDHVKNVSFLMNKDGRWHLSPAYDLTFAYNPEGLYTSAHQMRVNGKRDQIGREDLLASATAMELSTRKAKRIIDEVTAAVPFWRVEAKEAGLDEKTVKMIESHFTLRK